MPSITGKLLDGDEWVWFQQPLFATSPLGIMVQQSGHPTDTMTAVYVGSDVIGGPEKLYTTSFTSTAQGWSQPQAISGVLDPVPNGTPAIASDGTHTYVVYPVGAELYYIIDGNAPVAMGNNGISEGTSPALFFYGNPKILYCLYQSYAGGSSSGGRLLCMAFDPNLSSWSQINPDAKHYYGMSGSPSVALSEDGSFGYVIYQGYGINGLLSGSVFTSGDSTQLGLKKFIKDLKGFDLPEPYVSGSPSAAVVEGLNLTVAMTSQGGDILVLKSTGPDWVLPSPGIGTFPTLVNFNDTLVCFLLTSD